MFRWIYFRLNSGLQIEVKSRKKKCSQVGEPTSFESVEALTRTFPELPPETVSRFVAWEQLMRTWNTRMNLVSRQDIDHLVDRHLLHALSLTHFVTFEPEARVLDVGTGGGLPGIPLALVFPEVRFTLLDSVGKKVRAVEAMVSDLGIDNVHVRQARVESINDPFDYILGRAVTALPRFFEWTRSLPQPGRAGSVENGWLYFKGTSFREELDTVGLQPDHVFALSEVAPDPFFQEKFLLHFKAPLGPG
jgi:16S rRNA (guanine527-N7)-methyltransferase